MALTPTRSLGAALQHLINGHARGDDAAGGQDRALAQHIAQPHLHRIHAQRRGQAIHLHLRDPMALRPAKAAKSARSQVVRVDGAGVDMHIRHLVRPQTGQDEIAQHLGRGVSVGPGVGVDIHLHGDHPAILHRPPFGMGDSGVALVVPTDRFPARPLDFHRAAHLPGSQGQDDLHAHILAARRKAPPMPG